MLSAGSLSLSGSGGVNFWKLLGAAPNDIDIDSLVGVSGILASLPADTRLKLILKTIAGQDFAGAYHADGIKNMFSGIVQGVDLVAGEVFNDGAGNYTERFIEDNKEIAESSNSDDVTTITLTPDKEDISVGNLTDGKNTSAQNQKDGYFRNVLHGATTIVSIIENEEGWQILDTVGAVAMRVEPDGKIQTNQAAVVAPILTPVSFTKTLPIYDTNGVLVITLLGV